jgi:hypothetical protein
MQDQLQPLIKVIIQGKILMENIQGKIHYKINILVFKEWILMMSQMVCH